ncbi:MAG: hypothetical protein V1790_08775, partial [Planctomycetota bacterium]
PSLRLSLDEELWLFNRIAERRDAVGLRRFLQYKSLTDLVFHARVLCQYDLIDDPYHFAIARRLETLEARGQDRFLLMGPRQTYKTVLANDAWCTQRILRDPNETILQVGGDAGVASGNLEEIAAHFEGPRFQAVWGDWIGPKWDMDVGIWVKHRTKVTKDPTVGIGSPGKDRTSKHPRIIVCDDLETKTNAQSELLREGVKQYYEELFLLLRHGGIFCVYNTPWDFRALCFAHILDPKMKRYESMDLFIIPIRTGGVYLMPKVFNDAYLLKMERESGRTAVMCQMFLWPTGSESDVFDPEFMPKNVVRELPRLNKAVILDPTKGKASSHDPAGLICVGIDSESVPYVLDAEEIHKSPLQTCHETLRMASRHLKGGDIIAVEAAPGVTDYKELLEEVMADRAYRGDQYRVVNVEANKREKDSRIGNLRALWERGRFRIYDGMPAAAYRLFVQQLMNYPLGLDDLLDGAAYYKDISRLRPPHETKPLTPAEEQRAELDAKETNLAREILDDGRERKRMMRQRGESDFVGLAGLRN